MTDTDDELAGGVGDDGELHPLIRRRDATQATLDRFRGHIFELGRCDCARMVAWHLRQFGIPFGLSKGGRYSTPIGALRALRRGGVKTLAEHLEQNLGLERIAPAAALIGDILSLESGQSLEALTIVLGNGRVLGFHETVPHAEVMQPLSYGLAWRVPL